MVLQDPALIWEPDLQIDHQEVITSLHVDVSRPTDIHTVILGWVLHIQLASERFFSERIQEGVFEL